MDKLSRAMEYLSRDRLSGCGLMQVLKRGSGELIRAENEGVLLFDRVSGTYMLSAEYSPETVNWLSSLPNADLFQVCDPAFVPHVQELYSLDSVLDCGQYVYCETTPLALSGGLKISEPTDEETVLIGENYHKLDADELALTRSRHELFVGHDETGDAIGFIGSHLEGSMGLLHIFPEYRRKGYGAELESFLINRYLALGLIPYCHVEVGNGKSEGLQQKLGLRRAEKRAIWLF